MYANLNELHISLSMFDRLPGCQGNQRICSYPWLWPSWSIPWCEQIMWGISEQGRAHSVHTGAHCAHCAHCAHQMHTGRGTPLDQKYVFECFYYPILLCKLHGLLGYKGNTKTQLRSWEATLNIWCSQCAHGVHMICTVCTVCKLCTLGCHSVKCAHSM